MNIDCPTLVERIPNMSDEELESLAEGEALSMADSSKTEGLVLDQDKIKDELLAGYKEIKRNAGK